jgi:Uma2 family endonuclease
MHRATIDPMASGLHPDTISVPETVRFPVELEPPPGFDPGEPATWPAVAGRLEFVGGRLLYMPPCGTQQQGVAAGLAGVLESWASERAGFFVGANEAGMTLGHDTRGAEGAIWLRDVLDPNAKNYARVPPILAVEVAGQDESERQLRDKAAWYLSHGVEVVWVILPDSREVVVLSNRGEIRYGRDDRLAPHPSLPGLEPPVARFFRQID